MLIAQFLRVSLLSIIAGAAMGCSSKTEVVNPPERLSNKGEVCRTTPDCKEGLSCLPRKTGDGTIGVCVRGQFPIAASAKECAEVECNGPIDCCPEKASATACESYKEDCDDYGPQEPRFCEQYKKNCACDGAGYACDRNQCREVRTCTEDSECLGLGLGSNPKCLASVCVECITEAECSSTETCSLGVCVAKCSLDSDCPSFDRCVNGSCVDGTCQSNRECVALLQNVDAACLEGKCSIPCATDLECGNPLDYQFRSCIKGQCVYVGCETDKECELVLNGGLPPANTKTKIVCREKTLS